MKILDAQGLHAGTDQILQKLDTLNSQAQELQQAVEGIIALEDSLKGQGGSAIRSFYQEFHHTFLIYLQVFNAEYVTALTEIKNALRAFEHAENGFIHQGFLENDIEQALLRIEWTTRDLTNRANVVMQQVSDIVSLPRLQDAETVYHIGRGKEKNRTTLQDLHSFDQRAASSLDPIEHDIVRMQNFVEHMQGLFKSGEISVSTYTPGQLTENGEYRRLFGSLIQKAGLEPVETIVGEPDDEYKSVKYHIYADGMIIMEFQYAGSDNQVHYEVVPSVPEIKDIEDEGGTFGDVMEGIWDGAGKAIGDTWDGIVSLGKFLERNFNPLSKH
ncbi:MAG TPA: LXG domain-containing protein, partial [Bacillaceae bacterium]